MVEREEAVDALKKCKAALAEAMEERMAAQASASAAVRTSFLQTKFVVPECVGGHWNRSLWPLC